MNISVEKLLAKMEEELHLINEGNLREKVYSIKILCELILDEKQKYSELPTTKGFIQQPVITATQPKKLVVDDGANGDSLLDF
jgi:hypothetical protein